MPEEAVLLNLLGEKPPLEGGLVAATRQGIRYAAARRILERYHLDMEEAAVILGTSQRTLARRAQRRQALSPVESDRLVRFLRIAARAEDVLEDRERASRWLKSPNRALGGQTPMSLLDTDAGAEQVDEVLTRIDYGVYS